MPHAVPSSAGLVLYTGTRSDSSSGTTEEAGPSTTTATGDHWAISWVNRGMIQSVPVRLSMTSTWYKPSGLAPATAIDAVSRDGPMSTAKATGSVTVEAPSPTRSQDSGSMTAAVPANFQTPPRSRAKPSSE